MGEMKYLKLFEDIEEVGYKDITNTMSNIGTTEWVYKLQLATILPDSFIDKIKKSIKIKCRFEIIKDKYISTQLGRVRCGVMDIYPTAVSNDISELSIYYCDDAWFLVSSMPRNPYRNLRKNYICDDFYGLFNLLKDLKIIKK